MTQPQEKTDELTWPPYRLGKSFGNFMNAETLPRQLPSTPQTQRAAFLDRECVAWPEVQAAVISRSLHRP